MEQNKVLQNTNKGVLSGRSTNNTFHYTATF